MNAAATLNLTIKAFARKDPVIYRALRARFVHGLTLAQIAADEGVHVRTVSRWCERFTGAVRGGGESQEVMESRSQEEQGSHKVMESRSQEEGDGA